MCACFSCGDPGLKSPKVPPSHSNPSKGSPIPSASLSNPFKHHSHSTISSRICSTSKIRLWTIRQLCTVSMARRRLCSELICACKPLRHWNHPLSAPAACSEQIWTWALIRIVSKWHREQLQELTHDK